MLYTISFDRGEPTLADASRLLGVEESQLDVAFGVRLIDPNKHLYAVQARDAEASQVKSKGSGVQGPFSNPGISDFGPPKA